MKHSSLVLFFVALVAPLSAYSFGGPKWASGNASASGTDLEKAYEHACTLARIQRDEEKEEVDADSECKKLDANKFRNWVNGVWQNAETGEPYAMYPNDNPFTPKEQACILRSGSVCTVIASVDFKCPGEPTQTRVATHELVRFDHMTSRDCFDFWNQMRANQWATRTLQHLGRTPPTCANGSPATLAGGNYEKLFQPTADAYQCVVFAPAYGQCEKLKDIEDLFK